MAGQSIFISYRRTDTGGHVSSLYERLRMQFGGDRVFFDRSKIESGDVFPDTLRQGVEGCAVLLALIGPEWNGARRLDDPDDFVRREIGLALKLGKKVIPVLYEDAPFPPRDPLPKPLKALVDIQALTLRTRGDTDEYEAQLRKLVERIDLLGTWEQLRDVCKKTTDSSMSDTPRWYKKELYLERNTVRAHLEGFLKDPNTHGFILLGKSGVGKSNFLLALAEDLYARNDCCVLMYSGINILLNTPSALTNRISNDLKDLRLSQQPVQQVWEVIATLAGIAERKVVFCVDAVNENPQAKDLLRQLNTLVRDSRRWPWLKIIFSARRDTWQLIKVPLDAPLYYRGTESETPRIELQPFSCSALMEPFSRDSELPTVYRKYAHVYELQTDYDDLPDKLQEIIRDPFHLLLLAQSHKKGAIPPTVTTSASIIEGYVDAVEKKDENFDQRLQGEMRGFLTDLLVPLMVRDGHYSNVIPAKAVYAAGDSAYQLLLRICDADILVLEEQMAENGLIDWRVRFKYERFYEHFAGERLSKLSTTPEKRDKHAFFVAIIGETARKPFFWVAVRNALIKEASTPHSETILKLCHTKEQREKEMMVSVLTGLGSIEQVEGILRTLIPQERQASEWQKIRYLVSKPGEEADARTRSARKIAIEVASTLKLCPILQSAALHTDPTIRAMAVRYSYYLWQHDRATGFAVIQYLAEKATTGIIPNCLGLESIFSLSLIILCNCYRDEGVLSRLQDIWHGMIAKLFRVREHDSQWKGIVRDVIRKKIIAFGIAHVFNLLRELPASNMMNHDAINAFFHLDNTDKRLYKRMFKYFDVTGDYSREQMEQDYLAVLKIDNVLLRLTTTMGLTAHACAAPHAFLPFLKQLFEAAKSNIATYPYLNVIYHVPLNVLIRDKTNDEMFEFFVYTAEVCQECYTKHPEMYHNPNADAPLAPGVGNYIVLQYQREGNVKTAWLETRIQAALNNLNKPDFKFFELLLASEFPQLALEYGDPKPVLAALELFFETVMSARRDGSKEAATIADMIQAFLSRLRVYYPDQVEDFLAEQEAPDEFRLQVRTHEPNEKVGDLIGMRAWFFVRDSALLGPAEGRAQLIGCFEKAAECEDTQAWMTYVIRHLVNLVYGGEALRESG